jgi:hypothetical protein
MDRPEHFDLWAVASKKAISQEELVELFNSQLVG